MHILLRRKWWFFSLLLIAAGVGISARYFSGSDTVAEAVELRVCVSGSPPVPVVFTSRSDLSSLIPEAPEAEGFAWPGTIPWAAREGRLRLLSTRGTVHELTWGQTLPDGGTLIDVMSPSGSVDGKRILFAGRRAAPDAGHWRIYEIGVNGRGLRQITGLADDPGCIALPPLRFAEDGSLLPSEDRRKLDYDDVDPSDLGMGAFAFSSSRIPDLGRDHSRRATQLWKWLPNEKAPRPVTANRNNDRWPSTMINQALLFSLWSRNREVITADRKEIKPWNPDEAFVTTPSNSWLGARVLPDGDLFGFAIKIPQPVWRPRQLWNGSIAFMSPGEEGWMRLGQARSGHLRNSPSSLKAGTTLPKQSDEGLTWGTFHDEQGKLLSAATPSPCPPTGVVFAGTTGENLGYGIYLTDQDWSKSPTVTKLFDDPVLVDAEPVALYPRDVRPFAEVPVERSPSVVSAPFKLANGTLYTGPAAYVENPFLFSSIAEQMPSQRTDIGEKPLFPPPPKEEIKSVVFYVAHRDRFDDPLRPRVPGVWEKQLIASVDKNGILRTWIPSGTTSPTVLAGLDAEGRVVKWESQAADSMGQKSMYYAIAGDHYSGSRPQGYIFCLGCHTGHTYQDRTDVHERIRP